MDFLFDGLMLGFFPGCLIYVWYEYKLKWKGESKYATF